MKALNTPNLLRRTAAIAVASAASLIVLPASAASITFSGASAGESCAYSSMAVDPAGNVVVNCSAQASGGQIASGTSTPPSAGTFNVVLASATLPAGSTSSSFSISRTGGTSGAVTVPFSVTGNACTNGSTVVPFTDGQTASAGSVPLTITGNGSCVITLGTPTPAGALGLANATISIGTGSSTGGGGTTTANGVPIIAGCPTPSISAVMGTLPSTPGAHMPNDGTVNGYWIEPSGVVTAVALPKLPAGTAQGSVQLTYGSRSPLDPAMYEIAISKCPGVIDPTGVGTNSGAACYFGSNIPANQVLPWYGKNSVTGTLSQLAASGNCVADESQGPWYANIRYTYTGCLAGPDKCGQQIQWNAAGP